MERILLTVPQTSSISMKPTLHQSLFFLATLLPGFSETLDITDIKGRSFTANLVKSDATSVDVVRISDSKTFSLPLASLDEKTRSAIGDWVKKGGNLSQAFEISMNTGKTSRTTGAEDFDDKRVNLSPIVTVKNPSSVQETKPLQMTILFFGRPVSSTTDIHVFRKQTFDLPKISPLASKDFPVDPISEPYDNRGYAQFGSRYLGYAWVVHNSTETEIVASASVPSSISSKHGEDVLKLDAGATYTKELTLVPVPVSRFR